MKELVVSL